jgi:TPR repeat protein
MRSVVIVLVLLWVTPLSAQTFQRSYAIVVGIKSYESFEELPNAQADAESIASFLKTQHYEVTELYNRNARRSSILDAMDNVSRTANEHDRVLFFFAGHGYTETRGGLDWGYIVPYDGRPHTISSLIGMEELRTQSERMGGARHQLFLMDSCYGGSIGVRDVPGGVDPRVPYYLEEITKRVAREALTAGGKDQRVEDGARNGHSRFTAALLEALQEGMADTNSDGYITFPELTAYVLSRATSRVQTPTQAVLPGHGSGEYWFVSPVAGKATVSVVPEPVGVRRGDSINAKPRTREVSATTPETRCTSGDAQSCLDLAFKYSTGRGVAKDEARAAQFYQQACDGGNDVGCDGLAMDYAVGQGVPMDTARARQLGEKAERLRNQVTETHCNSGDLKSCVELGSAYSSGGPNTDLARAAQLYRQACDGGNARGCNHLGGVYSEGEGVAKDEARAVQLFRQACDGGDADGCFNLGRAYEGGLGVPKDEARAAQFYKKGYRLLGETQ